MSTNEVKFPKVAKISYTPQTLAAAIAKNVRLDRDEPLQGMSHQQNSWGTVGIDKLLDDANVFEITIEGKEEVGWEGHQRVFKRDIIGVACPTTGCIAGYAAVLSGDVMVVSPSLLEDARDRVRIYNYDASEMDPISCSEVYIPKEKRTEQIEERAATLLRLDGSEQAFLFSGDRETDEVLNALDAISSGKRVSDSDAYRHHNGSGHGSSVYIDGDYDEDDNWVSGHYTEVQYDHGCSFCTALKVENEQREWLNAEHNWKRAVRSWLREELRQKLDAQYSWLFAELTWKINEAQ
jgi:hypothetical protein